MALSDPHLEGLEGFLEERNLSIFLCSSPLAFCCPEPEHRLTHAAEGTAEGEQAGSHLSRYEHPQGRREQPHLQVNLA